MIIFRLCYKMLQLSSIIGLNVKCSLIYICFDLLHDYFNNLTHVCIFIYVYIYKYLYIYTTILQNEIKINQKHACIH